MALSPGGSRIASGAADGRVLMLRALPFSRLAPKAVLDKITTDLTTGP
jgi:hypothetical protein